MEEKANGSGGRTPSDMDEISLEREKLELERERLVLERERLSNERLRYKQTVELSNNAAGRIVAPASTFVLTVLVSLLIGGAVGAWIVARQFRADSATIAESVARAFSAQFDDEDGTNSLSSARGPFFRPAGRSARGSGYLLILD